MVLGRVEFFFFSSSLLGTFRIFYQPRSGMVLGWAGGILEGPFTSHLTFENFLNVFEILIFLNTFEFFWIFLEFEFFWTFFNYMKKAFYFTSGPRILWLWLVVVKPGFTCLVYISVDFHPFSQNYARYCIKIYIANGTTPGNWIQGLENLMTGIFICCLRVWYVLRAISEGENFDAVFWCRV